MSSLWNAEDRTAIIARLGKIDATLAPQWGQMCVKQMMAHLVESFKIVFNEKAVQVIPGLNIPDELRRKAIFGAEPWPQGTVQATPEYLPTSFDLAHLDDYRNAITGFVQRFADAPEAISWGRNAVFDELTAKEWGALCYRHLDHHLRQFGC